EEAGREGGPGLRSRGARRRAQAGGEQGPRVPAGEAAGAEAGRQAGGEAGVTARAKVLVVEDDAAIRRGLVDALRFGGFDVSESGDGREGLQTALAADVDLALLDVMLPGL